MRLFLGMLWMLGLVFLLSVGAIAQLRVEGCSVSGAISFSSKNIKNTDQCVFFDTIDTAVPTAFTLRNDCPLGVTLADWEIRDLGGFPGSGSHTFPSRSTLPANGTITVVEADYIGVSNLDFTFSGDLILLLNPSDNTVDECNLPLPLIPFVQCDDTNEFATFGEPRTQVSYNTSLSLDFAIADFADSGNFSLDLPQTSTSVDIASSLSLGVQLSEMLEMDVFTEGDVSFSPVTGVVKSLSQAFGIEYALDLDIIELTLSVALLSEIDPQDPSNNEIGSEAELEVDAGAHSLTVTIENVFFPGSIIVETSTIEIETSSSASAGVLLVSGDFSMLSEFVVQTPSFDIETNLEYDWSVSASVSETFDQFFFSASFNHSESGIQQTASSTIGVMKTTNISGSLGYQMDPLDITASVSNVFFRDTTNPMNNTVSLTTGFDVGYTIETLFGLWRFSAGTRLAKTSYLNDAIKSTETFSSNFNIDIPLSEYASLTLTPVGFSRTHFPNDPTKEDLISNETSIQLSVNKTGEDISGSGSLSVSTSTSSTNNKVELNASMSGNFTFNLAEDFSITISGMIGGASTNLTLSMDASF